MSIPDYQSIMLPLLEFAKDSEEHSLRESIEDLAVYFKLTDEERRHLLPSGQQATFDNRVGWAITYLKKANLLETTRRGYFKITERGKTILKDKPSEITVNFLSQFKEFNDFKNTKNTKRNQDNYISSALENAEKTPEEILETAYQQIKEELTEELLESIKKCSPPVF